MYINEQYHDLGLLTPASYQFIGRNGETFEETEPILEEHLIDVYINDQLTMKLVCIPEYLTELILGRLYTENIIHSTADVEQLYICEFGKRARVMLKTTAAPKTADYVETTPTCCTGNRILNDYFQHSEALRPVTPIPWKASWIFDLADRFAAGMPLHSQTWATHSCFLAREDKLLFQCEDIGRHNALDKAIGHALRHQIDLTQCILYSSGRIPTDMAVKAIRAGVPILASKASPSAEAVQLAKEYRLTLLCAARRDRMKLFCGPAPLNTTT
ncbi:MAG: formate dehydrogenase accessory sulfurtransferase FdhD [Eubacteriales bacterium]|nr:formate dehydrogenase accessory sulfurtransferase FdhD [Eubacteriales bacterium]